MTVKAIFLMGPTATGKSQLAVQLAKKNNAIIVNTDAMQIYQGLPLLTACPTADQKKVVIHKLYEVNHPEKPYSVGNWLTDVKKIIFENPLYKNIIFVGGTGLYFNCLLHGIAEIPEITKDILSYAIDEMKTKGHFAIRELLIKNDNRHQQIHINDKQRLQRALSVLVQTNKSIYYYYAKETKKLDIEIISKKLLLPPREKIYKNCELRIDDMLSHGVIEEVRLFKKKYHNPSVNIKKAIGYEDICNYLENRLSFDEMDCAFKQKTRNYIKRQTTWIRGYFQDWEILTCRE